MEYNKSDSRWLEVFGIPDFETYQNRYVVKGLFHPYVPIDVSEAFKSVEFMMAYAFYYYPLYDEAASKVLRIIEMAVKLRCKQLNIPLEESRLQKGKQIIAKKRLGKLMKELSLTEPEKRLDWQFETSRSLRNSIMHPERHSYSGATSKGFIERSVILFNRLFLPKNNFGELNNLITKIESQISHINPGPLVLEYNENRYLIEKILIGAVVVVDSEEFYCLSCFPVVINIEEQLRQHRYSHLFNFTIQKIEIANETLSGIVLGSGKILKILSTTNAQDILLFKQFLTNRDKGSESDKRIYDFYYKNELAERINEFWYNWMWRITA